MSVIGSLYEDRSAIGRQSDAESKAIVDSLLVVLLL